MFLLGTWAVLVGQSAPGASAIPERIVVESARIDAIDGVPRLTVNGQPLQPFAFFYNTDVDHAKAADYLATQVRMASEAGIHIHSLPVRCPRLGDGVTPNIEWAESLLERFVRIDDRAMFLMRIYPGPDQGWREWPEIDPDQFEAYLDGTRSATQLSMAADLAWGGGDRDLADIVTRLEAGRFGDRILLYHPGCLAHENFPASYREKGPDVSPANTRRFRAWLRERYATDAALREAWGRPEVTLDTAEAPRCDPARFPMHTARGGPVDVFYGLPGERDWVDFSAYTSDLVSERLLRQARVVREATGGRKLVGLFYGYTWELCGSLGGHFRLDRLLASPDVDVLASPYSYADRQPGGAGNFMSPVDSIALHGKLWMNEDDTRTSLADMSVAGDWAFFEETAVDLPRTQGILDRNVSSAVLHRAGTWWMDLTASNAFGSADLWSMLHDRLVEANALGLGQAPLAPDVALIVDERSKHFVKSDWDANWWSLAELRDKTAKTGVSLGYYLLSDFLSGAVPRCKAYVFPNSFAMTDEESAIARERLARERATAIWLYAPALLRRGVCDPAATSALTGMEVARADGIAGSAGEGRLAGQAWGAGVHLSPRLVVTDEGAEVLGRYGSDGRVSAARTLGDGYPSVLLGDLSQSTAVLRALLREAGAHVYTEGDEVVLADDRIVAVHSGPGGEVTVTPRPGTRLRPLEGGSRAFATPTSVSFEPGQTMWFAVE